VDRISILAHLSLEFAKKLLALLKISYQMTRIRLSMYDLEEGHVVLLIWPLHCHKQLILKLAKIWSSNLSSLWTFLDHASIDREGGIETETVPIYRKRNKKPTMLERHQEYNRSIVLHLHLIKMLIIVILRMTHRHIKKLANKPMHHKRAKNSLTNDPWREGKKEHLIMKAQKIMLLQTNIPS